ncbi:hypothetical protein COS31_05560 [Candidatus Roizmanbacteria bacterium CG02_land_8_20_14_3_00_36_15]|uniref:SHS2 domain-containing protein n=2 Tax=Candidatus Roizmaniibacteriota TaxID=1752723 RepID=A0A2M8KL43_9BACT|nr:MAG: hypothetical protein COS51_01540 [Candidatus Roizmanbacteria bacterium CG03_land_8_20_14_0_80_36_21]PIV37277.1 MAG: hypothetical protein COS31_05560 [Candidatus Roizmanbacteria bacterium CG02_land_8_20_14_3_00_36_15]PIY70646.1 MAG: hypothetical protein COY89_00005 [Candidatus Roizmanbacteria bacterium CG_4_10_14_0_8_um_filter_36_36]PJA53101.1 MAG: hypothetical protein CO166_03005 [Candidatus Roizmanbacteria bacterium CG_4_9_14_3_um_filter_36_11]PJC81286.1 MAG: hypothetical protein CO007
MANDSFCLEFGDAYARVADSSLSNQTIEIDSLAMETKPLTFFTNANETSINEVVKVVDSLINSQKITKKNVNIVIPDTYTYSQILTMPFLKEKELLSAIKYQADQFIPLPLDQAAIDLDILFEDKKNNNLLVLIVATTQNLIDNVARIIEKVGLIPLSIENELSAVGRLINLINQNHSLTQSSLLLNLGSFSTSIYFYNRQKNLISYIHNFKIGFDLFSREVQVNFNLNKQKADEALKSIGFGKNGSLDLGQILKPAFSEFIGEVEKFSISVKEKENITNALPILSFNLSDEIYLFNQSLKTQLGMEAGLLDISTLIRKNNNSEIFKQHQSSYISVVAGNIK